LLWNFIVRNVKRINTMTVN